MTGDAVRQRLAEISARADAAGASPADRAQHCPSCRCPSLGDEPTQQSATQRVNEAIAVVGDLVEHANPIAQDADGFVATGYTVTIGAIHRAKGWLQGAIPDALIDKVISNTNRLVVPASASSADTPRLVAALTAVLDRHQPEKRYQPWEACDHSWDTAQEAADAGCVELAEVSHFEVCVHCGDIEMDGENDRDYRESLWPCATYRAVAAALEESE